MPAQLSDLTEHKAACPLDCPDACTLSVTVQEGRVTRVRGDRRNPLTAGFICAKVQRLPDHLYGPERLLYPLLRDGPKGSGQFRRISWDEALDRAAQALASARDQHGGESIVPCNYGGSNGYLTQGSADDRLFYRLGASRLDRTLCAAPSGEAQRLLYGKMPGVAPQDLAHSRLIVMWGANPSASGIHLLPPIKAARRAGAKLVVVDPRRTPLAQDADLHLPLRPGTDLPLALCLIRALFEEGGADLDFLARHSVGADTLRQRALPWTWEATAAECGLSVEPIRALYRLYREIRPAVIRCGWGVERNRNGGSAVAAVLALPAVAGAFGVRGGGYLMSNSGAWKIDTSKAVNEPEPETRVINQSQLGRALLEADPALRLLFVFNCNPLSTLPDQERFRRGLLREDLFTLVHEQVMTDTARYADLLLPATTFLEHGDLARGYGALSMQRWSAAAPAAGEARPNHAVFEALLDRLGLARAGDPSGEDALAAAVLAGTRDGARIALELAQDGVATPPAGPVPVQFLDSFPGTADGRAHLAPPELDGSLYRYQPDPGTARYPLALISPALGEQTSSTFGQLQTRPSAALLHPEDAATAGVSDGASVRIYNDLGAVVVRAALSDAVRPGVIVLPKGLWARHTENGATANALIPDTLSDLGDGACYNDARVAIAPA